MRKILLTLAVLMLATPALAAVRIIVTDEGNLIAAIKYQTDGEKVRAFALDVSVSAGTIDAVSDYKKGESVPGNIGYGIFPANFARHITVDSVTGEVQTWDVNDYTPVADVADPGAAGALGSNAITIEMGALYSPPEDNSPNAPANSGILCKIKVSGETTVTVTENTTRGGVVLTDPAVTPTVDRTGATNVAVKAVTACFPTANSAYNDWVLLGQPDCWCAKPKGSGYQCDGDADSVDSGGINKFRVFSGDLNILVNNWRKKAGDATLNACADIDHKDSGGINKYRVFSADLNILVNNWRKKDAALAGDCPR
ncbi:MAG: hypothetical protein MUO33_02055 [Sedimentisphaerales bacterium]|nr:hypothetical protein [Sedimentisphaerales bacterium]